MRALDADLIQIVAAKADPEQRYDIAVLLDAVPPEMRLLHYSRATVPPQYLPSFAFYHKKIGPFHLDGLPLRMQHEVMFAVWRIVELGGRVPVAPMSLLTRELGAATAYLHSKRKPWESLLDRTPAAWRAVLLKSWERRTGSLPKPDTSRTFLSALDRICKLLWFAYDARPWWQREIWDLQLDQRIPRSAHELQTQAAIHWHRLQPAWLRAGAMFFVKSQLELGQMRWTTALGTYWQLTHFGKFLEKNSITDPRLVADPADLRALMLRYLADLRAHHTVSGRNKGAPLSASSLGGMLSAVRTFYAFMCDFGREAAAALDDRRWADLHRNYAHLRLWRPQDLPDQVRVTFDERHLISDSMMTAIASNAHLLGAPRSEGGLGDEQGMRILLLMMATGRRINEICRLDLEPIIPIETGHGEEEAVAKLRYQQTKIQGAPDTIFVGSEVIAIVAEQQAWLKSKFGPDVRPAHLFVRAQQNRLGQHPYRDNRLRLELKKLVELADLRELDGTPLRLSQTHRFRHTKATSLINAGVALHVVQRYMGHLSPEMTMHYAQTLDSTAKAEFLRYRKVTSQGVAASLPPEDLYDLMALDKHTDRVLPNGWCTLPPTKTCGKGNACLTCDLFVTDARFLGVHEGELVALDHLVENRQQQHEERTGQRMSENHVWLTLRRRERRALETIVDTLKQQPDGETAPIRGAGTAAHDDEVLEQGKRATA